MQLEKTGIHTQIASMLGEKIGFVKVLEGYRMSDDIDLSVENLESNPIFAKVPVIIKHGTIAHAHFSGDRYFYQLNPIPNYSGEDFFDLDREMMKRGFEGNLYYKKEIDGESTFVYSKDGKDYSASHHDFRVAMVRSAYYALSGKPWEEEDYEDFDDGEEVYLG